MTHPLLAAPTSALEPCAKAISLLDVAKILVGRLAKGGSVSRQLLKSLMRQSFGGSDAWGLWSMRDAYEALEVAQVLLALDPASGLIDYADPAIATAARDPPIQSLANPELPQRAAGRPAAILHAVAPGVAHRVRCADYRG